MHRESVCESLCVCVRSQEKERESKNKPNWTAAGAREQRV